MTTKSLETDGQRSWMSAATRSALELDKVAAVLSSFAATDLGAAQVLALEPASSHDLLLEERERIEALARRMEEGGSLLTQRDLPYSVTLARLSRGAGLDTLDILCLASLLEDFSNLGPRLADGSRDDLELEFERASSPTEAAPLGAAQIAQRARTVLDSKGEIRTDASPRLASLVSSVRSTRDRLYEKFEEYTREHRDLLADETVGRNQDRLSVLLPAGHRGRLAGIVHGRSASDKSYYFEPLELVEGNNRLQEQVADEQAERARILRELGRLFETHAAVIEAAGLFIARIDRWQSANRFARATDAHFAEVEPGAPLHLVRARHPLLDPRLKALRENKLGSSGHRGAVVPLSLEATLDRVLVITGPNAGGKTVALKTVGVVAFLARCGWPVPVEGDSSVPWLEHFIAVVGDEQDVLAERSTFSARLERLLEVWEEADENTLVLLDELGSGTNPEEGAALSVALLEHLAQRRSFTIMTTHLLQLANAALCVDGCASMAMEFDEQTGAPTYTLRLGAPGGSHAIELGRRLGLPVQWLDRAENLLSKEQLTLRHLIAETENARRRASELEADLAQRSENLATLEQRREQELSDARSERLRARTEAKHELESFRRTARDQLARELQRVRRTQPEHAGSSSKTVEKVAARTVAQMIDESGLVDAVSRADEFVPEASGKAKELEVGVTVRHQMLGWSGRLEKLRGQRAEVSVKGKRFQCSPSDLQVVASRGASPSSPSSRAASRVTVNAGTQDMSAELMLVGERVERALARLDGFLDHAVLANLPRARVVHGFGTGRLKEAVRARLAEHPLVAEFRSEQLELGGDGVTIVVFGDA